MKCNRVSYMCKNPSAVLYSNIPDWVNVFLAVTSSSLQRSGKSRFSRTHGCLFRLVKSSYMLLKSPHAQFHTVSHSCPRDSNPHKPVLHSLWIPPACRFGPGHKRQTANRCKKRGSEISGDWILRIKLLWKSQACHNASWTCSCVWLFAFLEKLLIISRLHQTCKQLVIFLPHLPSATSGKFHSQVVFAIVSVRPILKLSARQSAAAVWGCECIWQRARRSCLNLLLEIKTSTLSLAVMMHCFYAQLSASLCQIPFSNIISTLG